MVQRIKKQEAIGGLAWCFFERSGNQGVSFLVSIILARILDPSVYGVVALVSVFNSLIGVFTNSGFNAALIQKNDADELDYNSVFYFNCFMGLFLYIIMFCCAPLFASFYNDSSLIVLIRIHSLHIIILSLQSVQSVYARKNYMFQKFFYATLGGTIISAIIGIWMAYSGYGPWALIVQGLIKQFVDVLILWITVGWHPHLIFSFARLQKMFHFGWKILISSILNTWFNKLYTLCIGKFYTKNDLAYYHKGDQLPSLLVENVNGSINSVLFPSMSALQHNPKELRAYTSRVIKTSAYLIMPMMTLLAVTADSIVLILLTEKWTPCIFFLRVFCFTYAFYPIHTANLCVIQSMGRSDLFLNLEIKKKLISLVLIISTIFISVKALALSAIISSVVSQIINAHPNKKLLKYSYKDQLFDIAPTILQCIVMGLITYSIILIHLNIWCTLIVQIMVGITFYIISSWIFKVETFSYLLNTIKNIKYNIKYKCI